MALSNPTDPPPPSTGHSPRCRVISCFVFQHELEMIMQRNGRQLPVDYLPVGVHSESQEEAQRSMQAAVDEIDEGEWDTVLIAMGLCQSGVSGLRARGLPLVLPRANDCIGMLMGSRQRYREFLLESPDTFFLSAGWVVASRDPDATMGPRAAEQQLGLSLSPAELEAKYGADNAQFLAEELQRYRYRRHVYLSTGCASEPELISEASATASAAGCPLQVVPGSTQLLERLLFGPWAKDDFLVVPPRQAVRVVHGERLIDCTEDRP